MIAVSALAEIGLIIMVASQPRQIGMGMGGGMVAGPGMGMDPMSACMSPQPSFGAAGGAVPVPNMPSPWQAAVAMQAMNAFKAVGSMSPGMQGTAWSFE